MTRYDMRCFSCANVIEKDGEKYCAPWEERYAHRSH